LIEKPALPFPVMMIDRLVRPEMQAATKQSSWLVCSLAIAGVASFALMMVFEFPRSCLDLVLLLAPLPSSVIAYTMLMPRGIRCIRLFPSVDVEKGISALSSRTVFFLAAAWLVMALGLGEVPGVFTPGVLLVCLSKHCRGAWWLKQYEAAAEYLSITGQNADQIAVQARLTSWPHVATIMSFSLASTCNPFVQSFESQALRPVIASFISLFQIICMITSRENARLALWVLFLFPLVPYLSNMLAIDSLVPAQLGSSPEHPVEFLAQQAESRWEQVFEKQSRNATAASDE
jgi:hypothetical protein